MSVGPKADGQSRASRLFDGFVSIGGVVIAAGALLAVLMGNADPVVTIVTIVVAVPVMAVLAQFAVSLGAGLPSPNEPYVTFESAVLIFMVCTVDLTVGLLAWALGQLVITAITDVSPAVRLLQLWPSDDQCLRRPRRRLGTRRHPP